MSTRDYDAVLSTRPSGEPPRMVGEPGARRVVAQAWEWRRQEPVYRLHQFILLEEPSGAWRVRHLEAGYRAWPRRDLAAAAEAEGFEQVRWLEPAAAGFDQPVLTARAADPIGLPGRSAAAPSAQADARDVMPSV